jgi:hypothetical protein
MVSRNVWIGLIIGLICLLVVTGIAIGAKPTPMPTPIDPDSTGQAVQPGSSTSTGPAVSAAEVASQISPATANWELIWSTGTNAHHFGDPHVLPSGLVSESYLVSAYSFTLKPLSSSGFSIPIDAPMITDGKGPVIKTMYLQYRTFNEGVQVTEYLVLSGSAGKTYIVTSDSNPGYNLKTLPSGTSTQKIMLPSYMQMNEGPVGVYMSIYNPTASNQEIYIQGAGEILEYAS